MAKKEKKSKVKFSDVAVALNARKAAQKLEMKAKKANIDAKKKIKNLSKKDRARFDEALKPQKKK